MAAESYRNPRDGIRERWLIAVLASKRIDGETRALLLYLYTGSRNGCGALLMRA